MLLEADLFANILFLLQATMDATLLAARVGRVQELLSSISDVSQQSVPMEM